MDATRSPGWYPAPDGNGQQWWNGAGWSESRKAPLPEVGAPAPVAAAAPLAAPQIIYSASNPAPQSPSEGLEFGGPVRAPAQIDARANPSALYALIAGIFAVVFNLLLVPSILAIVFGVRGLGRARELASSGHPGTMRGLATTGLVLGIFGGGISLIQALVFIVSIISSMTVGYTG